MAQSRNASPVERDASGAPQEQMIDDGTLDEMRPVDPYERKGSRPDLKGRLLEEDDPAAGGTATGLGGVGGTTAGGGTGPDLAGGTVPREPRPEPRK